MQAPRHPRLVAFGMVALAALMAAVLLSRTTAIADVYSFDEQALEQSGMAWVRGHGVRPQFDCPRGVAGPAGTQIECLILSGPRSHPSMGRGWVTGTIDDSGTLRWGDPRSY
jgi:hypothetical protein